MKSLELRKLSLEKLHAELQAAAQEHSENYRTHSAGELPNPRVLRNNRRNIARIKTVLSEKRREDKVHIKEQSDV